MKRSIFLFRFACLIFLKRDSIFSFSLISILGGGLWGGATIGWLGWSCFCQRKNPPETIKTMTIPAETRGKGRRENFNHFFKNLWMALFPLDWAEGVWSRISWTNKEPHCLQYFPFYKLLDTLDRRDSLPIFSARWVQQGGPQKWTPLRLIGNFHTLCKTFSPHRIQCCISGRQAYQPPKGILLLIFFWFRGLFIKTYSLSLF